MIGNHPLSSPKELDELVRLVLSDLEVRSQVVVPSETPSVVLKKEGAVQPKVLCISDKLISLEMIEARDDHKTKQWHVSPRVVLTPMARDELKRRRIELIYDRQDVASGVVCGEGQKGSGSFLVAIHDRALDSTIEAMTTRWQRVYGIELIKKSCIKETTELVASWIGNGEQRGAIVITHYPSLAAMLANRRENLRALTGSSREQLQVESKLMGANLLVLDPRLGGSFRLQQLAGYFFEQGPFAKNPMFESMK